MSAISQKARPIHWDQVVGQEHVKDVLAAALAKGRVGHAYLFSGPRGVGKTTTARLIAMTANCEGPSPKPCGECESCRAVRAGSHPDVREIDAASNNSVEDVRELRENVNLAAMRGGKKIYILDEAHMMSRAAFNALLKTLEEPPSHVIFILATTEPEKILPTILSRCQHYRFRRFTDAEVAGKLARICQDEGVQAEPEALSLIGRLADGAMRDGESLLERMLAAGGAVTRAGVEQALGLPPAERVAHMARALALGEAGPLMEGAGALYRDGYAARTVVEGLLGALRDALHAELGVGDPQADIEGADVPRLLRLQAALDAQDARFARSADLMSLELALTHALLAAEGGGSAAGTAPASSSTAIAASPELANRVARLEREIGSLKAAPPTQQAPRAGDGVPEFDPGARRQTTETPTPRPNGTALPPSASWADVIKLADMRMRAFLKPARVEPQEGGLRLHYDERNKFHARQVLDKFDELLPLVGKVYGALLFEVVTSEGSKRGQTGGSGAAPVVPPPAPEASSPAPTVSQPRIEAQAEPELEALPPAPRPVALPAEPPPFRPQGRAAPSTLTVEPPTSTPDRPVARAPSTDVDVAVVAQTPPASLPSETPAPAAQKATYLEPEPITEEPAWDDFGFAPPGDVASAAPEQREPQAVPPPAQRPASASSARAAAEQGVRGHPVFEEAQRLFSGRVREAGKTRQQKAAQDEPSSEDVAGEPEAG